MQMRLAVITAGLVLGLLPLGGAAAGPGAGGDAVPGSYIVVLQAGDPGQVAAEHRRDHGAQVGHVYRHALRGYSARMSAQAAARVARDARVAYVDQDRVVTTAHHQCGHNRPSPGPCGTVSGKVTNADDQAPIAGATVSADGKSATTDEHGLYTIEDLSTGTQTVTASADGYQSASSPVTVIAGEIATADFVLQPADSGDDPPGDDPPDDDPPDDDPPVDYTVPLGLQRSFWSDAAVGGTYPGIAIIDTGIAQHSDLTIAGGVNCSNGPPHRWSDGNGHGTHVAGTVGALGEIVGVAPGASLYAVRVLNNAGSGTWADVICGVDWVTQNAGSIRVANMSLGGSGTAGSRCSSSSLRQAICNSVNAGVTYVVAAGNSAANAAGFVPAAYPETITVAALADFDGKPGGLGTPTCRTDVDDTVANFSNYGSIVDIIAPGVCITSTWHDGGYRTISGTSMASPHVAGAAAYLAATKSPSDVRAALVSAGNTDYSFTWNGTSAVPGTQWKLLDLRGL